MRGDVTYGRRKWHLDVDRVKLEKLEATGRRAHLSIAQELEAGNR